MRAVRWVQLGFSARSAHERSSIVRAESLYDTCAARALSSSTTRPSAVSDWLMFAASFCRAPVAKLFAILPQEASQQMASQ